MVCLSTVRVLHSLYSDTQTMAEEAPAPAAAPAKAAKKKPTVKPKKTVPSLSELVVKAVSASEERSGVSLAALKKALSAAGYDAEKNKARVRLAVKKLLEKGTLVQTKGSYTMSEKTEPKAAKKPAAKKAPAKAKKPKKSPKKTAKPAAAKKAAKSPKKVTKKAPAAKKTAPKAAKPKAKK